MDISAALTALMMDISAALTALGLNHYIPYATLAVSVCGLICLLLPAPKAVSGFYYVIYTIISKVALNFGRATNLTAPGNTGIVGGPTALSNPQIATGSVSVAAASPATITALIQRAKTETTTAQ